MEEAGIDWLVTGGLAIGALFGVIVQHYRFCVVAAVGNSLLIRDHRQLLAFALAWAVAIGGTAALELTGTVDIAAASYRNGRLDWLGTSLGGLVFGIGATLAGGCAIRTLTRTAEGNLNGLLALIVFALAAGITQFGLLAGPRIGLAAATQISLSGNDAGLAAVLGVSPLIVGVLVVLVLLGLATWLYRRTREPAMLLAGSLIGAGVAGGWYVTGRLAQDEFFPTPPSGVTVSGPLARVSNMITAGDLPALSFAMAFVIGVLVAAFVYSVLMRRFHLVHVRGESVPRIVVGAALMGIGATFAAGCNIGQGLSGASTLSVESLLAVAGIVLGIMLAVAWLNRRESRAARR
ncbi:MAG TPA: YeeE/YedE family protein [Thioalkalivibrio sp.]|nr:YeeE/YedE family protein [Thioalkalivibrio sp.]